VSSVFEVVPITPSELSYVFAATLYDTQESYFFCPLVFSSGRIAQRLDIGKYDVWR